MLSHEDYLRRAYEAASLSKDLSTQNGAILVNPNIGGYIVAEGWNDIVPEGCDNLERRQRPLKYQWTEHAERAAIYIAARWGYPTENLWLYAPWLACADCGRAIVLAGITKCIRHKIPEHAERPDWAQTIAIADEMFKEAGVEVVEVTGRLGVRFRFDGRMIEA
jgi:dCMP deaminase